MSHTSEFEIAWDKYKRNTGKTRTMGGVYIMAMLAETETPGVAKEFMEAWENRDNGFHKRKEP